MPEIDTTANISSIFILLYFVAVFVIAVASVITLAILHKHAEKPSMARNITVAYISIFGVLFAASLLTVF